MRGEIAWSQNDVQALLVNTCTRSHLGCDWISFSYQQHLTLTAAQRGDASAPGRLRSPSVIGGLMVSGG